jgi:CcmD family protein
MSLLDPGIAIYVALAVALATWLLLFAYIWRLDAQARELKRRLDAQQQAGERAAPRRPQATLTAQRNGHESGVAAAENKE